MQFKIVKELIGGRYFVRLEVSEITDADYQKFKKFGEPVVNVKLVNGTDAARRISVLDKFEPFGFYKQTEAEKYAEELKIQAVRIKEGWENLKDTWSDEEIL